MASFGGNYGGAQGGSGPGGQGPSGKGSASSGRPGGMGNTGQVNSKPTTTSWGSPIHYDNGSNPISKGITLAAGPALNKQNINRANTYNDAARAWNLSAGKPSLANMINNWGPMGFSMEPPDIARPATFSGGTYHLGWNPGSLASLAGGMIPGAGVPLGAIGQAAYTGLGGKNLVLSGPGSQGMPSWGDAPGQGRPNLGGAMTPGGGQLSDGGMGTIGNPIKPSSQAPGGAPFGAQPTGQPELMTTGGNPGMFRPQLPNHTLPQDYASLFPGSLSEQDKALLYAKALGGQA
jgi:hypothetical protein